MAPFPNSLHHFQITSKENTPKKFKYFLQLSKTLVQSVKSPAQQSGMWTGTKGGFVQHLCRGIGSTRTWKSITIPWLILHPCSAFAEHQKSKEIRASSNTPAGGSEKVWF